MKKRLLSAVLAASMLTAFAVPVLGADTPTGTDSGIYNLTLTSEGGVTVTVVPQTAGGEAITEADGFYANAEKVEVTYTEAEADSGYWLVLAQDADGVPTEDNIKYIDQESADGSSVSFTVYPSSLEGGTTYYIYVAGGNGRQQVASFQYYAGSTDTGDTYPMGDINEDNKVTPLDALWALQINAETRKNLTEAQMKRADVTGRDGITPLDALWILQINAGTRIV